jgi:hypothetical protein
MKRTFIVAGAVAAVALAGAANAGGAVIKTNWSERVDYANGEGFMRLYVRRLEVTRSTWKAAVGLRNSSKIPVQLVSELERPNPNLPFTYWAGPGIWWSSYVSGATWWPGAGSVLTHSVRSAPTRPAYPNRLAAGKSWFGTFSGPVAKLPKDRLLRIGFGKILLPGNVREGTAFPPRTVSLSTTHQFKLPRRLR